MRKSCLKQVYETSPKKPKNFNIKLQNSTFTSMIKKKKTHFEEKITKNTFPQQKNTTMKKKHKNHFCFLKTLAGRTGIINTSNSMESMGKHATVQIIRDVRISEGQIFPVYTVNLPFLFLPSHAAILGLLVFSRNCRTYRVEFLLLYSFSPRRPKLQKLK